MTITNALRRFKVTPRKYEYRKLQRREHSRHDDIQFALVAMLEDVLFDPELEAIRAEQGEGAAIEVDFESPCGALWADVVVRTTTKIWIIEIKTHNEQWNAGAVIRQLYLYQDRIEKPEGVKVSLILAHEGELSEAEKHLLAAKNIECVQVSA
jgi:hypothetical protein